MKRLGLIILTVLLVFVSAYFVDSGITGNVISQTCCSGETCLIEDQCRNSENNYYSFTTAKSLLAGTIFLASGVFYMLILRKY